MDSKQEILKALLRRFTSFNKGQTEIILRLLERARAIKTFDHNSGNWDMEEVNKCLTIFNDFFSYEAKITNEGLLMDLNAKNSKSDLEIILVAKLSILQYNISNKLGATSTNIFGGKALRIKNKLPKLISLVL